MERTLLQRRVISPNGFQPFRTQLKLQTLLKLVALLSPARKTGASRTGFYHINSGNEHESGTGETVLQMNTSAYGTSSYLQNLQHIACKSEYESAQDEILRFLRLLANPSTKAHKMRSCAFCD